MTTTQAHSKGRNTGRAAALAGMIALAVLAVTSPAVAAEPTLGPNLLNNGGFEQPVLSTTSPDAASYATGDTLPGWAYVTTANGSVSITTALPAGFGLPDPLSPAEGNQFIGIFGGGGPQVGNGGPSYRLFQQFPTEIGKTYQVSYWIAGGPNVETLCVRLICTGAVTAGDDGGGNSISAPSHYPTSSTWVQYSYAYTATTTLGNLYVYGSAAALGVAPLFDGVSVQEVIPAVVDTPIASAPVVLLSITGAGVALAGVLAVLGWRRRVASPAPR